MVRKQEWGRRRSDNQPYPKTRGKEALPKGLKCVEEKGKTHKHWVFGTKYQENRSHLVSIRHRRDNSKRRHDMETGKLQRWLKKRNLLMTDDNKDLYMRETYGKLRK